MAREAAHSLYVNLSASQVRKRLKGYGFGVRDVQASDRNQAVIIHTATGEHLRELERLFADVLSASSKDALGAPIENLRNLGATSAAWLREVGVHTKADLERTGPILAYQLVKQKHPDATVNLLWAMSAALSDKDVSELSEGDKARLRAEVGE